MTESTVAPSNTPGPASWKADAERYFAFLADRFPVMCASDEFHFLPRSQAAADQYHRMDDLSEASIREAIHRLKQMAEMFLQYRRDTGDLEDQIDLELLVANIAGVLVELEERRSWRENPLLYLKVAGIAVDHAWERPADSEEARFDRTAARLDAIPGLLHQAAANLRRVSANRRHASLEMIADCRRYVDALGRDQERLAPLVETAAAALAAFAEALGRLPEEDERQGTQTALERTLSGHFASRRTPEDIFDLATAEWNDTLDRIRTLARRIDSGADWMDIYHGYAPAFDTHRDTFALYREEVERLATFFSRAGLIDDTELTLPVVTHTPAYLYSVRSSASFAAALTPDPRESSYFYITPDFGDGGGSGSNPLKKRLHREFHFLTAHETIPGHHLLDDCRRRLRNPVRQQVESPLFYEGWATYVESLLIENGYIREPEEELVHLKRQLWRAARCRIDVGIHTGRLDRGEAIGMLVAAGFSPDESGRQVDRFRLNPGYQLCYGLGRHEFVSLKKKFASRFGEDRFHRLLLQGGELPFHLIDKRLSHLARTATGGQESPGAS